MFGVFCFLIAAFIGIRELIARQRAEEYCRKYRRPNPWDVPDSPPKKDEET